MSAQDLEQRARELPVPALVFNTMDHSCEFADGVCILTSKANFYSEEQMLAALRQQPAPVDLEQFRCAVLASMQKASNGMNLHANPASEFERECYEAAAADFDDAHRLLSIIDNAGKVASAEPAAWRVLKIGASGSAFDSQDIRRAYTYEHQPGNGFAWKLGRATSVAATDSAGDYIDRGLSLLNRLQEEGFGVFQIGPIEPMTHQPAPVVDDARMARALEWLRTNAAFEFPHIREHIPAIEEAIAAYDPNCGARTVCVVDDAMVEVRHEINAAQRKLDTVTATDDAQSDGIGFAENALDRALAVLDRAQGVQS